MATIVGRLKELEAFSELEKSKKNVVDASYVSTTYYLFFLFINKLI